MGGDQSHQVMSAFGRTAILGDASVDIPKPIGLPIDRQMQQWPTKNAASASKDNAVLHPRQRCFGADNACRNGDTGA